MRRHGETTEHQQQISSSFRHNYSHDGCRLAAVYAKQGGKDNYEAAERLYCKATETLPPSVARHRVNIRPGGDMADSFIPESVPRRVGFTRLGVDKINGPICLGPRLLWLDFFPLSWSCAVECSHRRAHKPKVLQMRIPDPTSP